MSHSKITLSIFARLCCLSMLIAGPVAVSAQDMSTYYTVTHPDEFEIDWATFYKTMTEKTAKVREDLPHQLDVAYGTDPKQKLDIYQPAPKPDTPAPVFLFLHGGGFREGDRAQYGAVAEPFAKRGIITVVASYRLTEDGFHYPDQPNDVKAAIAWLHENVAEFGGDPRSIYVGGHSAGAILAADIGGNRAWMEHQGLPKAILKGIVPISAPYDMRKEGGEGEQYAYAPTLDLQAKASPILHVEDPAPEAIVVVGSAEEYQQSSLDLVSKLKAAGSDAVYLLLEGMDHKDTALALADEDSELFKAAIDMMGR